MILHMLEYCTCITVHVGIRHMYMQYSIYYVLICAHNIYINIPFFWGGDAAPPSNSSNSGKKRFIEVP